VKDGVQVNREPVYFQKAQQYGDDDIGNTYVEVNLTAQHLFFYKDGKLVLESDYVSGNVSKGLGTPVGTYPIQYKDLDATLVGEDYETPVKYWMPFNKNIGLHDASWRKKFGKDIYLKNGSHGCINMPPDMAKKMYQNIQKGVAVVVYELPGTENYDKPAEITQETNTKKDQTKVDEKETTPKDTSNSAEKKASD
jgi:lipoprotein-anchoring transpeptidase ErfK/SrfK